MHKVWNDNTAVLSGDAMLILAFRYMTACPAEHLKEVMDLFSLTMLEICEGQQLDMEFESRGDVTEDEYIEMIRLKTAVLLAGSLKIGAILAGATAEDAENLYKFGMQIGVAFQLQDDLLDVYGDPEVFGKKIGGDILCNKKHICSSRHWIVRMRNRGGTEPLAGCGNLSVSRENKSGD